MANKKLKVFISYSSQDRKTVREIYSRLNSEEWIDPWIDEEMVLPGQDWEYVTERALRESDAIIVCLSKASTTKEGYVQKEFKYVFDISSQKPEGTLFIIPLRLDPSPVPSRFKSLQWVNYFEDKTAAYERLIQSLRLRADSLKISDQKIKAAYDLDEIYNLLVVIPKDELQELSFDRLGKRFYSNIKWQDFSYRIINEIIRYATDEEKLDDVLAWLQKNKPIEYNRYISRIQGEELSKTSVVEKRSQSNRKNPYIPTRPLPEDSIVFSGRLDIARKIAREMRVGTHRPSFLLYGRRRMGKTSALLNLQKLLGDKNTIDILVSGQSSKFSTTSDELFCYHLVDEIITKIKDSLLINRIFDGEERYTHPETYRTNPIFMLESFFNECYGFLSENDLYVLIMIDEYEELGKNLSYHLLIQLRDTIQRAQRYVFVFSGANLIRDLPNPAWSEVFVNVTTLRISFLDRHDGRKLLTEPIPDIEYENLSLVEKILDITGCQPFLLQAIAYEIVNTLIFEDRWIITKRDVDDAVEKVFNSRASYFEGIIWRDECSTNRHKDVLTKISTNNKLSKVADFGGYKAEIEELIDKDILKIENGYVKLCVPLIGLWVKKNKAFNL